MARVTASRKRAGFTRVDALVVLLFIVLGGGVLLAAASRVRGASDRATSQANLRQLVIGLVDFADNHDGTLPTGRANLFPRSPKPGRTALYGPCPFAILPFIEQNKLYQESKVQVGEIKVHAAWELAGKPVKVFVAPGDPTADRPSDRTSYLLNGLAFPQAYNPKFPAAFPDGTSQTIFFAEGYSWAVDPFSGGGDPTKPRMVARRWWDDPVWTPMPTAAAFQLAPPLHGASALLPQGFDPAGIAVGMGDGSSRIVNAKCSAATFYAACTPAGNDILGNDW